MQPVRDLQVPGRKVNGLIEKRGVRPHQLERQDCLNGQNGYEQQLITVSPNRPLRWLLLRSR